MIMVSAMSVRPRTSSTLTLVAFMSSRAVVTVVVQLREAREGSAVRERVRVRVDHIRRWSSYQECLGDRFAQRDDAEHSSRVSTDNFSHRIGHGMARIAPGDDQLSQLRRGDLELGPGMYIDAAGAVLVQLPHAAGASIDHDLSEPAHRRGLPARAVRDDDVRKIEQLAPAVPVGRPEECVHAKEADTRERSGYSLRSSVSVSTE